MVPRPGPAARAQRCPVAPPKSWSPPFCPTSPSHTQARTAVPSRPNSPPGRAIGAATHPPPKPQPPRAPGREFDGHLAPGPSPRSATGASFRANVSLPNSKSYLTTPQKAIGGLQPRPRKVIAAPQPHRPPALPQGPRSAPQPSFSNSKRMLRSVQSALRGRGRLESNTATKRGARDGPVTGDGLRKSSCGASWRALGGAGEPWPLG